MRNVLPGLLGLCLVVAPVATQAQTMPACNNLKDAGGAALPPPIYLSGSTALEPMLKAFGPKIASQTTNAYTLVYLRDGACSGVNRILSDGLIKQNPFY